MRVLTVCAFLFAAVALPLTTPVSAEHYDDEAFIVRCESVRGRDNYCPADTRGGVTLYAQLSSSDCIEGDSWGTDRSGIWVRSGCRAEFAVASAYSGGQSQGGYGRPWQDEGRRTGSGRGQRIVCESHDRRSTQCPIRVRNDVELVYQISSSECRFNWSWGFDSYGIWVARGCRAEFMVY